MHRSSEIPHRPSKRRPSQESLFVTSTHGYFWDLSQVKKVNDSYINKSETRILRLSIFETLRKEGRICSVSPLVVRSGVETISVYVIPKQIPVEEIDFKNSEANTFGDEVITYGLVNWDGKRIGTTLTFYLEGSDAREAYAKMMR